MPSHAGKTQLAGLKFLMSNNRLSTDPNKIINPAISTTLGKTKLWCPAASWPVQFGPYY